MDPLRQMRWHNGQLSTFSRGIRPPPPTVLVAGGGWLDAKMHDIRALLAFRQFVALAGWGMVQKLIIILSDLPWNDDGVL